MCSIGALPFECHLILYLKGTAVYSALMAVQRSQVSMGQLIMLGGASQETLKQHTIDKSKATRVQFGPGTKLATKFGEYSGFQQCAETKCVSSRYICAFFLGGGGGGGVNKDYQYSGTPFKGHP